MNTKVITPIDVSKSPSRQWCHVEQMSDAGMDLDINHMQEATDPNYMTRIFSN